MQIPKDILEIKAKFDAAGKELFLVGGCVRDFKLNLEPKDFDMATNAFPEEIEQILSGYKFSLTGKQFGVMRVFTEQSGVLGYEIATYREDISVGRQPEVKVGSTMEKDAWRRDFTINALYYDINASKIIDLVGGEKDLEERIIRACGDPIQRIKDDALRMLRAVRFKNTIDGTYAEDLDAAMRANPALEGPDKNGNIVPISQERIAEEFLKALSKTEHFELAASYVRDLDEYQFLGQVFRGLHIDNTFKTNSSKPEIMIADLLRFNTDKKDLFNKLVYQNNFSKDIANGVIFLLGLEDLYEDNAYKMRKEMNSGKTNLTNEDLLDYWVSCQIGRAPKYVRAFMKYSITTDGDELKANEGFVDGPELGMEIEKRERENFLKILNHEKI